MGRSVDGPRRWSESFIEGVQMVESVDTFRTYLDRGSNMTCLARQCPRCAAALERGQGLYACRSGDWIGKVERANRRGLGYREYAQTPAIVSNRTGYDSPERSDRTLRPDVRQ